MFYEQLPDDHINTVQEISNQYCTRGADSCTLHIFAVCVTQRLYKIKILYVSAQKAWNSLRN